MKRIKIFLASSITDLKFDRVEIGNFFRQMNDIYIESGVYFDLIMCEDYDNTIAVDGKQSQFDQEIRASELVFFLFFKKVGDYTRHEFEVALDQYKEIGKPKILTYFKYVDSPENAEQDILSFMQVLDKEIRHYYNVYNCIDTLKLGIFMQIKMMHLDESEITFEDGKIFHGNREIADTRGIPLFSGNEHLTSLRERLAQAQKAYLDAKSAMLEDGSDDAYIRFGEAASAKAALEKECKELESSILSTAKNIAEQTSGKAELSEKQKQAYRFMERGLWKEALEILDTKEILSELTHNESMLDSLEKRIETNVNELLQRIEVLRNVGLNRESLKEVLSLYEKVYETTLKYNLSKKPLLEYAHFLHTQNDIEASLRVAAKLSYLFSDPDAKADIRDRAKLAYYTGLFNVNAKRYEEAEKSLQEAVSLYESLADMTDEERLLLARSYNSIATSCFYRSQNRKMEQNYRHAMEIFRVLYQRHTDVVDYAMSYAMIQDNYGIALDELGELEESEKYHLQALALYTELAEKYPLRARLSYARCHHNTACLYQKIKRYEEAEAHFLEAIRVREEERLLNPHAVEPLLSGSYWSIGNLYTLMQENEKALDAYESAYKMRLVLRRRTAVYGKELYNGYYRLKSHLSHIGRQEEADALTKRYVDLILTYEEWADTEKSLMPHFLLDCAEEFEKMGNWTEALRYVLPIFEREGASETVLWLACKLAEQCYEALGDAENAQKYCALREKY